MSRQNEGASYSGKPPYHPAVKYNLIPTSEPASDYAGIQYRYADYAALRSNSPNRDSLECHRHSAASTDSGQGGSASSQVAFPPYMMNQHRFSGHSCESGLSSRSSYHSSSSSSLGSLDRLEESGYSSQVNVAELVHSGVSDHDVIHAWLRTLNYEEYYNNFVSAGYDMGTISRMTPEDLNAIGITKPGHRKRLTAEIAKLHIPDGIPDYRPGDVMEWLHLLSLTQYYDTLMKQGYHTLDQVVEITWEDLEEIGINKLGHQKKMILAIDRLKRIKSGAKRQSLSVERRRSGELQDNPRAMQALPYPSHMRPCADFNPPPSPLAKDITVAAIKPSHSSCENVHNTPALVMRTFQQPQHGSLERIRKTQGDMTPIVGRQRLNSSDSARSNSPTPAPVFQTFNRSNEDHEAANRDRDRSTESPTRRPSAMVSPRIVHQQRPIAKIAGNTRSGSRDDLILPLKDDLCKDAFKNIDSVRETDLISPTKCAKTPPPPPKRVNSVKSDDSPSPQSPNIDKRPLETPERPKLEKQQSKEQARPETKFMPLSPGEKPIPPRKPGATPPAIARIASETSLTKTGPPVPMKPQKPPAQTARNRLFKQESSDDDDTLTRSMKRHQREGSASSLGSQDTLPFANENVGTIKQLKPTPMSKQTKVVTVDVHEPFDYEDTATMKRRLPTPLSKMDTKSRSGAASPCAVTPLGAPFARRGSAPAAPSSNLTNLTADYPDTIESALAQNLSRGGNTENVLNDIDSMLQDLNDELENMLVNDCENNLS